MKNIKNYEIYKKLSKKYNLTYDQVEEICKSQFDFIEHEIKEDGKKDIFLSYLGTFYYREKKKKSKETMK